MNIENQLSDLTADLVELEEHTLFLKRLFSTEAGRWTGLSTLYQECAEKLDAVAVQVTWLDYPDASNGYEYCLIVFFSEELHWSNVALYNRQWFLRRYASQTRTNPVDTSVGIEQPQASV
jgi:hypothetical protein